MTSPSQPEQFRGRVLLINRRKCRLLRIFPNLTASHFPAMKGKTKLQLVWWLLTTNDAKAWSELQGAYRRYQGRDRLRKHYAVLDKRSGMSSRERFRLAQAEQDADAHQ